MKDLKNAVAIIFLFSGLFGASNAGAEMVAMDEFELSKATGEGLGFAFEDFMLDTEGASLSVTGITDSTGEEIDINWTKLYIGGELTEEDIAAGRDKRSVDIGSYNHPWVIRSVRGAMGDDIESPYSNVGNDIALLEFATDKYTDNLQNSVTYGQYTYYENRSSLSASDSIGNQVAQLDTNVSQITERYSGLASFEQLQDSIDTTYFANDANGGIQVQEIRVDNFQATYDQAKVEEEPFYADMVAKWELLVAAGMEPDTYVLVPAGAPKCFLGKECGNGDVENCSSTACRNALETYNDSQNAWDPYGQASAEALDDLTGERQILFDRMNATGSGINQYSYVERIADRDRFVELCGFDGTFSDCQSGLLARKTDEKSSIDDITVALFGSSPQKRRGGLVVRSEFDFRLQSTDQDGTKEERSDSLDIALNGLFIDGTSFRFWSRDSFDTESPGAELNGELRLNMFVENIQLNACGELCVSDGVVDPLKYANTTLNLNDVLLSLNLGYGEVQPMKFSATSDGNFIFELVAPNAAAVGIDLQNTSNEEMQNFYDDYYANAPKSFFYVGDVNIGGNSVGSSTLDGLRAQYLRVQSRDL